VLKKSLVVFVAFLLLLAPTHLGGEAQAQNNFFSDVPTNHEAHKEIHYLRDARALSGYPDGTFRPNNSLTRAQAAVIMTNILGVGERNVSQATFPDVPKDFWASGSIEQAAAMGIFSGRDGRFYPNEQISRAQVAAVLSKAFKLSGQSTSSFTDIQDSFWAVRDISSLERNGILKPGGRFEPNRSATRGEFAAYVARANEPSLRITASGDEVQFTGRVINTSTTLNVRSQPSMSGAVLGKLSRGATVDIYGESGNWYTVKYGSSWGYVHRDYIERVSGSGSGGGSQEPSIVAEGRVTATSLNVRERATASSNTIGRLSAGQTVDIYGYEGNWVLIKFNGQWAYTHIDYLVTRAPGSNGLANRIIAIDPGHGGTDPGAVANGLREKDIVLGVSRELDRMLRDNGASPFMTRTNDIFLPLAERVKIAQDRNADIFVSVHANAAGIIAFLTFIWVSSQ
jgi:N-acetylmuramoyl-L-alanine amidase